MNRLQILRSTNENYSTYDKILEEETGLGAVWLGDIHSLQDHSFISNENIKTIVSCCKECVPPNRIGSQRSRYISIMQLLIKDKDQESIETYFDITFQFIQEGREIGSVLLHCMAGMSRSATIMLAYMMRKYHMSLEKALNFVRQKRKKVKPNEGFIAKLVGFQRTLKSNTQTTSNKQNLSNLENIVYYFPEASPTEIRNMQPLKSDRKPSAKKPLQRRESKSVYARTQPQEAQVEKKSAPKQKARAKTQVGQSQKEAIHNGKVERMKAEIKFFEYMVKQGKVMQCEF